MPKLRFDRLLILLLVLFLAAPFWNWFKGFNYEFWGTARNVVLFFESSPLVTLLVIGLAIFLFTKRNR